MLFEYIKANSRKELFEKLEHYHSSKNYSGKHCCYEFYENPFIENDNEYHFYKHQISIFDEIKKETKENCSICGEEKNKNIYLMYEYYWWENENDYMIMEKSKTKIIICIICKECFIKE